MTPFDIAEQQIRGAGWDIDAAICSHLRSGWMMSTPDFFGLVRVIWRDWPEARRANPYDSDPAGDTLWVWCLTGDLQAAMLHLSLLPPKKWFAFARRDSPRFYSYDRFRATYARHAGQSMVENATV